MSASLDRFGAEVRARREARGDSLRDLARRCGLAPSYVSDIENGRRAPALPVIEGIAAALECRDEIPRWMALCGRVPDDITAALLARPSRWDEVRALLARSDDGDD